MHLRDALAARWEKLKPISLSRAAESSMSIRERFSMGWRSRFSTVGYATSDRVRGIQKESQPRFEMHREALSLPDLLTAIPTSAISTATFAEAEIEDALAN